MIYFCCPLARSRTAGKKTLQPADSSEKTEELGLQLLARLKNINKSCSSDNLAQLETLLIADHGLVTRIIDGDLTRKRHNEFSQLIKTLLCSSDENSVELQQLLLNKGYSLPALLNATDRKNVLLYYFKKLHELGGSNVKSSYDINYDLIEAGNVITQLLNSSLWTYFDEEERYKILDIVSRFDSQFICIQVHVDAVNSNNINTIRKAAPPFCTETEKNCVSQFMKLFLEKKEKRCWFFQSPSFKQNIYQSLMNIIGASKKDLSVPQLQTLLCLFLQNMFLHEHAGNKRKTRSIKMCIKFLNTSESDVAESIRNLLNLKGPVSTETILQCIKDNLSLPLLVEGVIFEEPKEYGCKAQHSKVLWLDNRKKPSNTRGKEIERRLRQLVFGDSSCVELAPRFN